MWVSAEYRDHGFLAALFALLAATFLFVLAMPPTSASSESANRVNVLIGLGVRFASFFAGVNWLKDEFGPDFNPYWIMSGLALVVLLAFLPQILAFDRSLKGQNGTDEKNRRDAG